MATINIGTNKGNITQVRFNKPFKEITFTDIQKVVSERYGVGPIQIFGWAQVYPKRNKPTK